MTTTGGDTKHLYVVASDETVGSIVEEIFKTELNRNDWLVSGIYNADIEIFQAAPKSVVVIDTALPAATLQRLSHCKSEAIYVISFSETNFDKIHDSIEVLIASWVTED